MPSATAQAASQRNPFPGLRSFEPHERHLFFGRDEQVAELVTRLRKTRFLAVVGTSGSGKSSLVLAGLIPCLYGGIMRGAGSHWHVARFRPGSRPIGNLAKALLSPEAELFKSDSEKFAEYDPDFLRASVEVTLERSGLGLVESVRQSTLEKGENLLIVVDQFEELFRLRESTTDADPRDPAAALVNLLLEAVRQSEIPIYVIITMRSDYFGACAQYRNLPEAINQGQYLIPRMTREQRRAAIEQPVKLGGDTISAGLVQRILNDVGDDPGRLPVMQHALRQSWDYWQQHRRAGEPLDIEHYDAICAEAGQPSRPEDPLAAALSKTANEAFAELKDSRRPDTISREQALAKKLFQCLTEPDERGLRHPMKLGPASAMKKGRRDEVSVCDIAQASAEEMKRVVDRFHDAERGRTFVTFDTPEPTPDTMLDISHESLIQGWDKLQGWVREEAEAVSVYRALVDRVVAWSKKDASLYRDPELQRTLNWRDQTRPTPAWSRRYFPDFDFESGQHFLEDSLADRERVRQHERRIALAFKLGTVALTLLLLSVFLFFWDARKSLQRLAQRSVDNGWQALIANRSADALSWFADGSHLEPIGWNAGEPHRFRLSLLTGQFPELRRILTNQGPVKNIELGPEAKLLLARTANGAGVWNLAMASPSHQSLGATGAVYSAVFDATGSRIVSCGDQVAQVWDAQSGALLSELPHPNTEFPIVYHAAFSPDQERVVTACEDGVVRIWNWRTKTVLARMTHGGRVYFATFSPAGTHILSASGGTHFSANLWTTNGELIPPIIKHSGNITMAAFGAGGRRIITAGADGRAQIWGFDPARSPALHLITNLVHQSDVLHVGFNRDGRRAASASRDGTVKWWDNLTGTIVTITNGSPVRAASFSPDSRRLATADIDGRAVLWDLETGIAVAVMPHRRAVNAAIFNGDGNGLITAADDQTIRVWQLSTIRILPHLGTVISADFSRDGERVVTASEDDRVRVWGVNNGQLIGSFGVTNTLKISYAADGTNIAAVSADAPDETQFWQSRSGGTFTNFMRAANPPVPARIVNERTTVPIDQLPSNLQKYFAAGKFELLLSPDHRWIVSRRQKDNAEFENVAWLWDARSGRQLCPLPHRAAIRFVVFSPNDRFVLTCSEDRTARLWEIRPSERLTALQSRAWRLTGGGPITP